MVCFQSWLWLFFPPGWIALSCLKIQQEILVLSHLDQVLGRIKRDKRVKTFWSVWKVSLRDGDKEEMEVRE